MAVIGTLIGGKYEILKEVGRGGMSIVYLAMDKNLNKQWAVKEIRDDVYGEEHDAVIQSFLTEANLMKKLDHPVLPRIVDIIDNKYVVMDYIEGEDLEKILEKYGAQEQKMVISWGKTLCEVLDYLHTRVPPIIYRDMKPGNIKLRPDGTIRLFDFGIAREYKKDKPTDTISLGTRGYAAPEQFERNQQTDARTDVYGLGMTLYHLVTGKNPSGTQYKPIRDWDSSLSSGLEWIIQKSTQLRPEDRFQSCAEMLYALENVEKYSGEYKKAQKKKIHLFAGFMLASAVCLCVGVGSTFAYQGLQNQNYEANLAEDTVEGYKRAIELDPERADAYNSWMNLYMTSRSGEEGVIREEYTAEAAKEMEEVFSNENLEQLKDHDPEGYAEVCYNAGYLNWYYYGVSDDAPGQDSASEQITRIVRSVKWFQKVKELNAEDPEKQYLDERLRACVECYYNIGYFFQSRENAELGDTGGKKIYEEYFRNVMELIKTLGLDKPVSDDDDTDVNTVIRAQMYNLIIYSLDSDIELFKNQGISKEEALELFNIAAENTKALKPDNTNTQTLKEQIESRCESVEKKIALAYEEEKNE